MTVRICRTEELPEGAVRREVVDGRQIAVARHRGEVHGFSAICPHQRHDLADGFIADDGITCDSHLWHFRFSDGRCALMPEASIPVFPAREVGGWVVVDLPEGP
jgi:nitrite reductase/ring-hydroxylating ferredoxin subunit